MSGESIIKLEEAVDSLEHTQECITKYLYEGYRCHCGVEDIREAVTKYRLNAWKEMRTR